jgi:ribosomal protein S18 acetylase RimI-like enzyme
MDVYKRFGVDTAVELLSLGTHRLYRQRGIANKMMEAALLFCEGLGLRYLKGECSSIYSQKIYEKLGFETLHTFNVYKHPSLRSYGLKMLLLPKAVHFSHDPDLMVPPFFLLSI